MQLKYSLTFRFFFGGKACGEEVLSGKWMPVKCTPTNECWSPLSTLFWKTQVKCIIQSTRGPSVDHRHTGMELYTQASFCCVYLVLHASELCRVRTLMDYFWKCSVAYILSHLGHCNLEASACFLTLDFLLCWYDQ